MNKAFIFVLDNDKDGICTETVLGDSVVAAFRKMVIKRREDYNQLETICELERLYWDELDSLIIIDMQHSREAYSVEVVSALNLLQKYIQG